MSIFLAHATLATPKLDRMTVESVLAGQQEWPHTTDAIPFEGIALQLSVLEELGLVAFYAEYFDTCNHLLSMTYKYFITISWGEYFDTMIPTTAGLSKRTTIQFDTITPYQCDG